jgi:hypothetical protein
MNSMWRHLMKGDVVRIMCCRLWTAGTINFPASPHFRKDSYQSFPEEEIISERVPLFVSLYLEAGQPSFYYDVRSVYTLLYSFLLISRSLPAIPVLLNVNKSTNSSFSRVRIMPDINSFQGVYANEEPVTEKQFVADGILPPEQVGQLRPSDPNLPIEELRERLEKDNYLFLKGLLPREDVLKAREGYFKFLSPSGVLKPGTEPVEGIFDLNKDIAGFPGIGAGESAGNGKPGGDQAAVFVDLALQAHMEDFYAEDFCKHPALISFIAKLTGWGENTLMFRRSLLRNNIPGAHAIGVHYDQIFLRHGDSVSNITAWCPMGDIKVTGGGLIYLENSE